jgi:hypothetical protein
VSLCCLLVGVLDNLDDYWLLVLPAKTLKEILELCDAFVALNLDNSVLPIR